MNSESNNLVVQSALICEDVRTELNGKLILIGVYSSDIGVPQFPTRMNLSVWMQLYATTKCDIELGIRAFIPEKIKALDMKGRAKFEQDRMLASIATPRFSFELQQEGALVVQIKENENNWRDILSLPILKRSLQDIDLFPDDSPSA